MNALVKKEIRLLLPSFGLALALALSIWLIPTESTPGLGGWLMIPPLLLCPAVVVLMALDSFGREFGANTFAQLLAQPVSRASVWRTKTALLALGLLVVFGVWWLSLLWHAPAQFSANTQNMRALFTTTLLLVLTAYSGGLWSVMLLRQVGAAFWFTLIIPAALAMLTIFATEKLDQIVYTQRNLVLVLGTYSVVGFFWARRLFLTAQDPGWTGGTLTLPTVNQLFSRTQTPRVTRFRPLIALFRKEIQFQQISVVLAALLFVAHLVVIGCQSVLTVERDSLWKLVFDGFWVLWFILPLIIGCSAVAEERRLGTLEPQLCLPVSRTKQFYVKLGSVMLCALILGTLPVFLIHFIGMGFGLATSDTWVGLDAKFALQIANTIVVVLGFYASTVCRHFLQAIATTIGFGVMLVFLGNWLVRPAQPFDFVLWEGLLGLLIGGAIAGLLAFGLLSGRGRWRLVIGGLASLAFLFILGLLWSGSFPNRMPVISLAGFVMVFGPVALVLVLAYRNFSQVNTDARLWRRNLGVWFAGVMIASVLATATYHRVWEFAMRFEPPAGPARLSGPINAMITKNQSGQLWALLPDGRLWTTREHRMVVSMSPRTEFVGSNWIAVAVTTHDGAGVQSDGSLWGLSWWEIDFGAGEVVPAAAGNWNRRWQQMRPTPIRLGRIGGDSDWVKIVSGSGHYLALKRDGTLWGWGDNRNWQVGDGLPDTVSTPVQLGTDADWDFIAADAVGSVAVKRDRTVWKWGARITKRGIGQGDIGDQPQQIATLPAKVSRIVSSHVGAVFICEDGTGWGSGLIGGNYLGAGYPNRNPTMTTLTKLWDNGHWKDTGGENWYYVAGIQSDGSLWLQDARISADGIHEPVRLGRRNDWLAMQVHDSAVYVLGKDGTLCRFGDEFYRWNQLTRPTRRATWSVNLLDAAQP
jgi:ABC-type transport system involved in multi-copper enzyme maturation permease subunit